MHKISTQPFNFQTIHNLILNQTTLEISEDAISKIKECRAYLEHKIAVSEVPIYGINTGFGALCNVKVSSKNLKKLQANLVRSHAFGTGDLVPQSVIKLMLLLKIKALCFGYSGVQLKTVQRLVDFYNSDILESMLCIIL